MRKAIAVLAVLAVLIAVVGGLVLTFVDVPNLLGTSAKVPDEYAALVKKAAKRCPVVPANVLAAQIASESGWDPKAESSAGAQGIAQFMPKVWDEHGIDADGDGKASVWNPVDAIASAAELNCVNADLVADVPGDRINNILAAYNAGFNTVVKYDGVPPYPETQTYVKRIRELADRIQL